MYDNSQDNKPKMQSLMDLISKMKELQANDLHGEDHGSPKGLALEMHEVHAEPLSHEDVEKLEEATHTDLDNDNEEGESPEHKAAVLGEESPEHEAEESPEEDHMEPMSLPPELMKLIQQHLLSKK